jgi:hypothetical protein
LGLVSQKCYRPLPGLGIFLVSSSLLAALRLARMAALAQPLQILSVPEQRIGTTVGCLVVYLCARHSGAPLTDWLFS